MGRFKIWTDEEELYLQDHWGSKSVSLIAKHLKRPYGGVRRRATELGLLDPTLHYDGITVRQLTIALGVSGSTTMTWILQHEFPAKQKIFSKKQRIYVVSYDDFWEWAENHKHLINFAKMEPLLLGKEPEWVKEKREIDRRKFKDRKPWTEAEKKKLISMVNSYQYTYPEIASRLKRPEASIKRKLLDLNLKARPLGLDKHIKYTQEEKKKMINMVHKGYSFNAIADELNKNVQRDYHKSASGIRGKLERMGYTFHGELPIFNEDKNKIIV